MGVRIGLGEPFWSAAGARELVFALESPEGLSLQELCARLAVPGVQVASDLAGPPLFVLNGRILSNSEAHSAVVHDGDHLLVLLMLSGG
jgi:sulfur carrier protein ThiS